MKAKEPIDGDNQGIPPRIALTIAGSDSSGGAGIQADLKTFHRFGVYGASALTLITAQNTVSVREVHLLEPELVTKQIAAVAEDLDVCATKTGSSSRAVSSSAHRCTSAPRT